MARTIDAIIKEVSSRSDPQRQTIMKQVADIPRQIAAEEAGLRGQLDTANKGILNAARERGVGAGGIPIGEQREFAANNFAPALSRLRTSFNDRKSSLESALSDIGSRDFANAQDIFRDERDFAENARRFQIQQEEAARARAAASRAASAEQNILAKYGIDLNNLGGTPQVDGMSSEESRWNARQDAKEEAEEKKLRNSRGLKVLSGNNGLTTRGNGSIPTQNFTGTKRLPGF